MEYQKIMCEFCKECKDFKLNTRIEKIMYENDVTIVKCDNFQPKFKFESSTSKCCSFLVADEIDLIVDDDYEYRQMIKLSKEYKVFYMERRTYKHNKSTKCFILSIDNTTQTFRNKTELLKHLANL